VKTSSGGRRVKKTVPNEKGDGAEADPWGKKRKKRRGSGVSLGQKKPKKVKEATRPLGK